MTVYRVYNTEAFSTSWHTSKDEAWKEAKRRSGKKKSELKQLGFKRESYKQENVLDGDEQMMLQGR